MIGSFNLLKHDFHINNRMKIEFLPHRRHAQSITKAKPQILYKEIIVVDVTTCTHSLNKTTPHPEVLVFK